MTKTYRLNYESVVVSHALFDKATALNSWKISSRLLREYIEFFSPKTEQLDFTSKDGKAIFTSFTEKIMDGKDILKQPLETAISISVDDFEDFHTEENVHITISVKDFRAIVTHAETLKGSMSAHFSRPARPLQFSYQSTGMDCQFVLMTKGGDYTPSATPAPRTESRQPSREVSRQPSHAPIVMSRQPTITPDPSLNEVMNIVEKKGPPTRQTTGMGPPPKPVTMTTLRERRQLNAPGRVFSQATTASDRESESLFMPRHDDDEGQWDPPDFEQEEPEEMLGWDVHADVVGLSVSPLRCSADISCSKAALIPPFATRAATRLTVLRGKILTISKGYHRRRGCHRCVLLGVSEERLADELQIHGLFD